MSVATIANVPHPVANAVASAFFCLVIAAAPPRAQAQRITVDGRLSPAQTLAGPNYQIGPNLGRQVGGNLFHSFGQFGLTSAETATFSGPPTVTNVIGRVTGGSASSIDGAIKSSIAGANLYLINPSGIVFGPNATINVSGSFHASSADYLRMSDGAKFQATNPDGSTLSAAPPAAFGFLNATPGTITVSGSGLQVPDGQTIGLVGGPVTINQGGPAQLGAFLVAPSGTVHVTSAAGAGEVPVDPTNTSALTVANFGSVRIAGNSTLDISNQANKGSGGSIFVRGGTVTIDSGGGLEASNFGAGPGGRISVFADSQIALSNGARIHAFALAAGRGGDISLATGPGGNITATGGTGSLTLVDVGSAPSGPRAALPTGGSGRLTVSTGRLTLSNNVIFGSEVQGSGPTGPLSISAGSIVIDGSATGSSAAALTGIRSLSLAPGSANAADIMINTGTLTILANGEIVSNTRGAGNAGQVSVNVGGSLVIDATSALFSTGIGSVVSPSAAGSAGAMTINAGSLSVIGNTSPLSTLSFAIDPSAPNPAPTAFAGLSAQTLGAGTGGTINLAVSGDINLSGTGPQITARSAGTGDAGAILVSAMNLQMTGGAAISTEAILANGGNIGLTIGNFMHLVDSQVTTSVKANRGNGGNIAIASNLLVLDRSQIIAQAVLGHGGNITIVASNFLPSADSLVSASSLLGISGTIDIVGPRVDLNGSLVVLSSELRSAAAIFRDSCAARGNRPRSSLTQAGRGGLPQDPDAALLALYAADRDFAPVPGAGRRSDTGSTFEPATAQLTRSPMLVSCP